MVDVVRMRRGPAAVPDLPRGGGWLFAETAGDTPEEARAAASKLVADGGCLDSAVITGPAAAALWRIREDGAGLSGRTPAGAPAWPGWEDSAVPVPVAPRLPARTRGAYGRPRGRRPALRALRRRLRARSVRLPAPRPAVRAAGVHAGRGPAGRLLRRVDVRRARGRPGPRRAPPGHVLDDGDRPVRRGEAAVRPGQPAQPGRDRRSGPARRRPAGAARPAAAARPRVRLRSRRRRLLVRRAPLHRRREMPGRQHRLGRRDVPVLPGDEGREGLHQGPRAGAAGARQRLAGLVGLAVARGGGGARPLPVLQGLLNRLPGRGGHGHLQGRGALPAVPGQAPARVALRARLAAPLGGADVAPTVDGEPRQRRPAVRARGRPGQALRRHRRAPGPARVRDPELPPLVRRPPGTPAGTRHPHPGAAVGGHVHQRVRAAGRPGRGRGPRSGRLPGPHHRPQRLLRPHLDLNRPAGRGQAAAQADTRRTSPGPRGRHPGGRARAVVHGRAPRRRGRAAAARPPRRGAPRRREDAGRAAHRHRRLDPARPVRRHRGGPAALPPARGPRLGRRQEAARKRGGDDHRGRRLLRPGGQLRRRARPLRRVRRRRRDRPASRRPQGPSPSPKPKAKRKPTPTTPRRSWPTASPAAPSSTSSPTSTAPTWPSC